MTEPAKRRLTCEDFYALKFTSDVQISPDGNRIAYVLSVVAKEADDYRSHIWMVDSAGGRPREFTSGPKKDSSPRWSPDGKTLAFISDRSGKNQIFLIDVDGGEARQLTKAKNGASNPVWSPDGKSVAFIARTGPEDEGQTEETGSGGGAKGAEAIPGGAAKDEEKKFRDPLVVTRLKYKANGRGLLDYRKSHIWVIGVDGGPARQVTDGEYGDTDPAWSPDGKFIAFASNRTEDWDLNNLNDIWVVPAEGGEARKVTNTLGPCGEPVWSPDGTTIAYVGHQNEYRGSTYSHLYTIPAAGGEACNLTASFDQAVGSGIGSDMRSGAHNGGPVWSADGTEIYFPAAVGSTSGVYKVAAVGGAVEPVLQGAFSLVALSYDAVRRHVGYAATDHLTPADVWSWELGAESAPRRLTKVNDGLLSAVALSAPETIHYKSVDGLEIEGWLVRPVGMQAGKKYPMVLEVHGGPHSAFGHAFFMEFQILASLGYAVLYTNPRGSGNYGQDFTRSVVGDWGGMDYQDLMAGVDYALATYDFLDAGRLGVTGGSYGGFMTNWIVGHTDRFIAAVTQRSVVDRLSFYGTSDIGALFGDHHFPGNPWDDTEKVLDRSPLQYVKNVVTPLLIIHSEQDIRCPIGQAEELFTALRRQKKVVEFVRFPAENHELSRSGKPSRRVERYRRITGWFLKYNPPKEEDYDRT